MTWRNAALVAILGWAAAAQAGAPTVAECLEGSDFIVNAAVARDHGMPRATFIAKLEDDLLLIRAFPPELRWFAKDVDDERFLVWSAQRVFDQPLAPEAHRVRFLDACFARAGA